MNYIFISYSRKDETVVNSFAKRLRDSGLSVWLDTSGSGTGIPFSTKWFEIIEETLYMSSGAIIFKSEHWSNSVPCNKEFDIIKKCEIPYVELNTNEVEFNSDSAFEKVKNFYDGKVEQKDNILRTTLFASAYKCKTGVHQLVKKTKISVPLAVVEYIQFRSLIKNGQYKVLNPEIFPYMKKYLRFIMRRVLFKSSSVVLGVLLTMVVVGSTVIIPLIREIYSHFFKNSSEGQCVSGQINDLMNVDAIQAIYIAAEMDYDYLTSGSYYTLYMYGSKLLDSRLPEKVLIAKDEEYEFIKSCECLSSSSFYVAEPVKKSGSIILTEILTGDKWTINTPSPVENIAWNKDESVLVYSAGSKIFVYDAGGKGRPVQLSGNYEQVLQLKFLEFEGDTFIAAQTNRETILLWKSPFLKKSVNRKGVEYGIFVESKEPAVVYVYGKDIVIKNAQKETVFSPDIPDSYGEIMVSNFDVAPDGKHMAFICEKGDATRIICIDLKNGNITLDIPTDYKATSVVFSEDCRRIYASAWECAMLSIDIASKEVFYGLYDNLYFGNIGSYRENWLLTDYNGNCCIFNEKMEMLKDCGPINFLQNPFFDFAINQDKDYLFTVNRGAGITYGCSRFNIKTGETNFFVVPAMDQVDSNTAVALSSDEKYVAYGYPNGIVRVYEQKQMYLVLEKQCMGESVSAILFSDDGNLYMLGSTGNIYMCQLPKYELTNSEDAMMSNWQAIVNQLIKMKEKYYAGISK